MLAPAVLDFIEIFDAVGSFIFGIFIPFTDQPKTNVFLVERANQGKPCFHIQTCSEIVAANAHFPMREDVSVIYTGSQLYQKADMLQGMIRTLANDVTVSVVYAKNDSLAHYLVGEAMKQDHTLYVSGSGVLMASLSNRPERD
ncbi:hypothetical protein DFJ58DRAFT_734003 [Suillus subalutaceus]|uniref:uncharacterized protein n=1 Tax=Suillus subalutaceus TaxID=48586 RepID=UPI001B86B9E8|nr:uncharacterized protein DFJ58DRAFT_734003 [Suillus subalutaceus]KAG1838077.1 hypothetical protein DFJ58DRAFT_734003 [Suillus subalutaceus]